MTGYLVNRTAGIAQKRIQQILQRAASAQNAGLHCADAAFQNFGDFFVAQNLRGLQKSRRCENIRHLRERGLHGALNFQRSKLLERRGARRLHFQRRMALFRLGVDRKRFSANGV